MTGRLLAAVTTALLLGTLIGCAPTGPPHLTMRLWDDAVAQSYRESFDEFEDETGIAVDVVTVPWSDYWVQLRADLAAGQADDLLWVNAANFREYADAGMLRPVDPSMQGENWWVPSVVTQYTHDGELWGVPQLVDPGIGIVYNRELLAEAGYSAADVEALDWDPRADDDGLRAMARGLTADTAGRHPGEDGFDPARVAHYGFSASNDLNGIVLQFLAGNGAAWQHGDRFVFDSPEGREAIGYLVDLIEAHLSLPAGESNPPGGADATLDAFLRGEIAMYQTGAYNLPNIDRSASFEWGVAGVPAGPEGALTVTNGIVVAAPTAGIGGDRSAQTAALEWLASPRGVVALAETGAALPAMIEAQSGYFDHWLERGVDVTPLIDELDNGYVQPPQGARYPAAQAAYEPLLNDVFARRVELDSGLRQAAIAANEAIRP